MGPRCSQQVANSWGHLRTWSATTCFSTVPTQLLPTVESGQGSLRLPPLTMDQVFRTLMRPLTPMEFCSSALRRAKHGGRSTVWKSAFSKTSVLRSPRPQRPSLNHQASCLFWPAALECAFDEIVAARLTTNRLVAIQSSYLSPRDVSRDARSVAHKMAWMFVNSFKVQFHIVACLFINDLAIVFRTLFHATLNIKRVQIARF